METGSRRKKRLTTKGTKVHEGMLQTSEISPDVLEVVETLFPGEPFGGADCAFGEAAAGFGVVAEIDSVGGRFEDDLVEADYVAFAEGGDFESFLLAAGFAD
jgi:hypothetical protein